MDDLQLLHCPSGRHACRPNQPDRLLRGFHTVVDVPCAEGCGREPAEAHASVPRLSAHRLTEVEAAHPLQTDQFSLVEEQCPIRIPVVRPALPVGRAVHQSARVGLPVDVRALTASARQLGADLASTLERQKEVAAGLDARVSAERHDVAEAKASGAEVVRRA
ncbi:hypothetical protein [Streptomyces sp. 35G-GA-8]|uniref:hypothetical protein n=1 Tax=Streptomyces sp. 35G-GA-8 TaxID=2939434 RepID=UPI00201F06FD|nr:hypothetical protein [Streptomyces sp. 35G-GA-8]MCL7381282.1 hypothetical protein [Streptomyces sp. 35G-GA-8]